MGATGQGLRLGALAVLAALVFAPAGAQPVDPSEPTGPVDLDTAETVGLRNGSFVLAPIPFENPSLGSGLALGGAYLFQADPGSGTSFVGLGAFKTSNDSRGYGFGLGTKLRSDQLNFSIRGADADLNYDLYAAGTPVPITQSVSAVEAEFGYGFRDNLTAGVGLSYANTVLSPRLGVLPPNLALDADLELAKGKLFLTWDSRDDSMYPTTGALVSGEVTYGTFLNASDRDYWKAVVRAAGYRKLLGDGVLAGRVTACSASSDAPFFDACALGATDSFRGYSSTEFIDDALLSFQAEYRGQLYKRLGYVVFAGAGAVGPDLGAAAGGSYRTAAGIGIRYRLSKTFPLDYAIDLAANERGESLLYVSVGQRF